MQHADTFAGVQHNHDKYKISAFNKVVLLLQLNIIFVLEIVLICVIDLIRYSNTETYLHRHLFVCSLWKKGHMQYLNETGIDSI